MRVGVRFVRAVLDRVHHRSIAALGRNALGRRALSFRCTGRKARSLPLQRAPSSTGIALRRLKGLANSAWTCRGWEQSLFQFVCSAVVAAFFETLLHIVRYTHRIRHGDGMKDGSSD
jgi:hypothetical protein